MPPSSGSTYMNKSYSIRHLAARMIRTMSSRLALGLIIIIIALLSFSSVLFSGTPYNDVYYPGKQRENKKVDIGSLSSRVHTSSGSI